jgi:2-polyprenyl-3-methyl-5-hydroxy-6-metoxy-1,4-benzoquinol methylase
MASPTQTEYILGRTLAEHDRLNRQGRLISKLTQHFLEETGLTTGMRVLDIGSGVGDVALLAAGMVGGSGQVVGIDSDIAALKVAEGRARQQGLRNVLFQACDIHRYEAPLKYDAVIGRCVLLHQRDPLATLQAALKYVRRGGIIAFQEPWFSRAFSCPEAPLFQEMIGWLHNTVLASGLDADIGVRLPSLYLSAGLPRPTLTFEMLVDCTPESEIYDFCTDTVRSLLPRMQELGITTAEEVQLETLAPRIRREARDLGTVVGVMPLVGAWANRR